MKTNTKIIILRGNSGSGKTTIAKKLQRHFGRGTMLISQDMIRREVLYVRDSPETQAIDLMIQLVRYGKENNTIIIVEGILYADWYGRLFEIIRGEFEKNIYAFYFDIPFEETLLRHKTKPHSGEFGEKEMKSWWRSKDYLGIIPEHMIDQDMEIEEIVDMIVAQVNGK